MTEEQIEKAFTSSLETKDMITIIPTMYSPISFRQLKNYYESAELHLNEKTFEKKLNLKNKEGKYNKLAELLSDTNRVGLIYARFNGKDKSSYGETIDHGNQCLITSIERMKNRLEAENFGMSKITFQKRIDKQLVDADCLREALYNAVAHNDWENSRIPIIYRFSDRFEILSYGGIPNGQTKEKFLMGISKPRSESLMRVLRDLGYAERTGHGVLKIVNKYGTKSFTFGDDYIIVTLPFDKEVSDSFFLEDKGTKIEEKGTKEEDKGTKKEDKGTKEEEKGTKKEDKGTKIEEKGTKIEEKGTKEENKGTKEEDIDQLILKQISNMNKISINELATISYASKKTIRYHIDKLRDKGIIKRIGSNRGGHWIIINSNENK